jgi:hypothetical protein
VAGRRSDVTVAARKRPLYKVSGVRTLNTGYAWLWNRAAMGLDYPFLRRGLLTMAPSQLGVFARSSPDYATHNPLPAPVPRQMEREPSPFDASGRASATCVPRAGPRCLRTAPMTPVGQRLRASNFHRKCESKLSRQK